MSHQSSALAATVRGGATAHPPRVRHALYGPRRAAGPLLQMGAIPGSVILGLSTWLVALAFVEPRIGLSVSPFAIGSQLWGGLLAVSHDRARAGIGAQRKPGLGRPASGPAPEANPWPELLEKRIKATRENAEVPRFGARSAASAAHQAESADRPAANQIAWAMITLFGPLSGRLSALCQPVSRNQASASSSP